MLFLFYTESDHISIWINLYDSFKKTFLYFSSRIKKDYSFLLNLKKKKKLKFKITTNCKSCEKHKKLVSRAFYNPYTIHIKYETRFIIPEVFYFIVTNKVLYSNSIQVLWLLCIHCASVSNVYLPRVDQLYTFDTYSLNVLQCWRDIRIFIHSICQFHIVNFISRLIWGLSVWSNNLNIIIKGEKIK